MNLIVEARHIGVPNMMVAGRYRFGRLLGAGASGQVRLALDEHWPPRSGRDDGRDDGWGTAWSLSRRCRAA